MFTVIALIDNRWSKVTPSQFNKVIDAQNFIKEHLSQYEKTMVVHVNLCNTIIEVYNEPESEG